MKLQLLNPYCWVWYKCEAPLHRSVLSFFKQCVVNLNVENTGTEAVYFTYYTPLHWLRDFSLSDKRNVTKTNPLCLQPGNASQTILILFEFMMPYFAPLRENL